MSKGYFRNKDLLLAVFLIFFYFLICSPVMAAEGAHSTEKVGAVHSEANGSEEEGHQAEDRSADLIDLAYRFLNFTLMVIILVVVIKKARLTDYLTVRSNDIRKKLEDLKKDKDEAEKKCRDMEGNLRDFELKRSELLEEFRKEGITERDRIIAEAQERVKQIIAQAEASMEQEIRSARNRLKLEISEMAIGQAREIIRTEISEKDHDNLVNQFIERVRVKN